MPPASTLILYVDRATQQWIVLDQEGALWALPATSSPWDDRQPFSPTDETALEQMPGHYKPMIGIPN